MKREVSGLPYARRMVQIFRMHDTVKWECSIDAAENCTAVRIKSFSYENYYFA